MWEVLKRTPRGSISPRKFSLLLATFLMACFGYMLAAAPLVGAAPDAAWNQQSVRYGDHTYDSVSDTSDLPSGVASSPAVYQYLDTSKDPAIAHFIYFGSVDAQSEKEATYVRYTLDPPNDYTNKAGEKTLSITPVPESEQPTTEDSGSSCTIDGIGWIVCPLMNGIAEGMDYVFEKVRSFLVVQPMTTSIDNPVYRIWQVSRDLANIAFVIAFLVIIYSYIVGGGFSGYEIRKIIPRLVIAAILINISYVICAVAVDISNIAGYGVNALFETVRDNTLTGSVGGDEISWTSVTTWVLAGGTGTVAGGAVLIASVSGGATGLWFLLAPFLLGAALVVMVTFLILAARQAIIILAIAIAPLAFAAYILPNTEKWFEKWRSLFFTMLIMFPAFAAVFGGAQLAGELIIRMAAANGSIELIILGLGVMVAPLAITPLLLKLGGGLLNRIGGIVNNRQKGLADRYKNYNKERLADHVAQNNARNAEMRANNKFKRYRIPKTNKSVPGQLARRYAARKYARDTSRSTLRKNDEEAAENSWHNQHGKWGYSAEDRLKRNGEHRNGYRNLDLYKRDNQLNHGLTEASHEKHWQQTLDTDTARRQKLTDTRLAEGHSKIIQGAHEAQDERTLQTALNTDAEYASLRNMKVQTSVNSGIAELHKAAIDSAGKLALSTSVTSDRDLRVLKVDTYATEKQAEIIENTLQKQAETRWNQRTRTEEQLQSLRLDETRATFAAQDAEDKWNSLVENIKAKGNERNSAGSLIVKDLADTNAAMAGSIKAVHREIEIESQVQGSAKYVQQTDLTQALNSSTQLRNRAAGVDPRGAGRVLAAAKAAVTKELITNTDNFQNTLDYDVASDIDELERRFKALPNDTAFTPERVAYARLLGRNGSPGVARLMKTLGEYTAVLPPDDDSVMLLKEILAGEQSIKTSSRAFEVWSQNERDDSGNLYANFDAVNQSTGIWKSITGQRFSSMAQPAQEHGLKLLQSRDPDALRRLVERVAQDPSAMSGIKDKPLEMVKAVMRGEDISNF